MKMLLQEDDCAPDALEYFCKQFEKITGMSFRDFKNNAKVTNHDGGMEIRRTLGKYRVTYRGDNPWYELYLIEDGDE